jgi:hypothetical protein
VHLSHSRDQERLPFGIAGLSEIKVSKGFTSTYSEMAPIWQPKLAFLTRLASIHDLAIYHYLRGRTAKFRFADHPPRTPQDAPRSGSMSAKACYRQLSYLNSRNPGSIQFSPRRANTDRSDPSTHPVANFSTLK